MSGSITERPLKDGRAEVSVILHTKNALTFACPADQLSIFPPEDRTLWFGNLAPAVAAGAAPALGESHLPVVFANTAPGAPLPDLVVAFIIGPFELELRQLSFRSNSTGPLHAAAGLGPEGAPGRCIVSQTGLFMTAFKGATADAFPAEVIDLRAIGK
jgi:hypothetical protein